MIIVFDAQCLLCCGWVRFLLKHDRRRVFCFASMQSNAGQEFLRQAGLPTTNLETLLLIDGDKHYQTTAAILRVLHELGWPWRLAWLGWLVPASLRDAAYHWLARNRYGLFGRSETCLMPSEETRGRFLE